jgi:hypothetical protein
LRRRHYTATVAALPRDDPLEMLELADEVDAARPTDDAVWVKGASGKHSLIAWSRPANWPMNPAKRAREEMPQPAQPAGTRSGPRPAPRGEPLAMLTDFAGKGGSLRSADDLRDESQPSQATSWWEKERTQRSLLAPNV